MKQTYDVNIESFKTLTPPAQIKEELPVSDSAAHTVIQGRKDVENILNGDDKRLLVIAGPCSIHDVDGAMEYAQKMKDLRDEVKDKINLIMRVYFDNPGTTVASSTEPMAVSPRPSTPPRPQEPPSIFWALTPTDHPLWSPPRGIPTVTSFSEAAPPPTMIRSPWARPRTDSGKKGC